jgi:hypothetical protein
MKHLCKNALLAVVGLSVIVSGLILSNGTNELQSKQTGAAKTITNAATGVLPEKALGDIQKSLAKQEYHISYDEKKNILQSPNRQQNLRAYYKPGKLAVQNRIDTTGHNFKLELVNEGIFADGRLIYKPEQSAEIDQQNNKLLIDHHQFIEEYINNEDGVRQNFIINEVPQGTKQLQVTLSVQGLKVRNGAENELHFYNENKKGEAENKLVYSDLKCWDANKKPLSANLAYVNDRIEIKVDVAGAAYPVTIDPIIANGNPQNPNKILEINQSNMWLGFSVSSAGDVNGDGYSDVIVGAPKYDLGQDNEGAAFVYKGHASGLTLTAVTLECNQANAQMGYSVSTAGDFNGDGFSDVLVGIPFYDAGQIDQGVARLYLGSGTFFTSAPSNYIFAGDDDHAGAYFGIAVATAGDVNGDGFSDVLIGASQDASGQTKEGLVGLCYGSANGSLYSDFIILQINQANAMFGYSVAPAGDIDADGFSDIIVGARYYTNGVGQDAEGAAFIYRGSAGGIIDSPVIIEGNQYDAGMGNKVSSAGDVNGDGYSDILIGALVYDGPNLKDQGRVYLHLGSSTGIDPQPARTFEGGQIDARMGSSVACAGDVNGDGYSDIMLGAQYYDNGQKNEGAVFVYHGSKDGIVGNWASMLESNQGDGWFGTAVASAGDVNGDGYSDILVGCYTFDNGQNDEGHVFVYHGGAEGLSHTGFTQVTSNSTGAQIGFSVRTAGDVNADGYSDVIVGAPYYDLGESSEGVAFVYYGSQSGLITNTYHILEENKPNSRFGVSVSGAGDVNGDGFDDVVVGADTYSNGQENEGAIFIYHGSAAGVGIQSVIHFERNFADSYMGRSVASGGDVNRDGYADIVVGAPGVHTAYVYQGSSNGITGNPTILQGDQNNGDSNFGISVASAGDVNGDGYGDVIVGDDWYAQGSPGAAYIFHGSNTGIATNAAITLQSNQQGALMGRSVAGAGDINGDGYSDIIVGAPDYGNGQDNEGVALIYYGSSAGIPNGNPVLLEMNKNDISFGSDVNSAGDVNGDGYSDVIVGARQFSEGQKFEGAAYVFHGSPTGPKATAAFELENTNITNAILGCAVAGAGDVNGDGYSDIIVGATGYLNGPNTTGSAFVYYGNNSKGLRNNVRLYNSGLVGPYDHNQFNQQNFGLGLFAKSFLGRNKSRLVWETRANGNAFSKANTNPITTSTQFTGEVPNLTNLPMTGAERSVILDKTGTTTRVRIRMRYSPALAITGQVYGPWRYVQSQLAGYNNAPVPEEAMAETIKKEAFTGLEEGQNKVTLYPNPVADRLFIKSENTKNIRSLRLLTTGGKLVYQTETSNTEVDVKNLDAGMYILLVTQQDGSQSSHKVIVRK